MNFLKASVAKDRAPLGRFLTSWSFTPPKSNRFLLYILGLLGALVVFVLMYGSQFLPWLKKIPDAFLYMLFLAIGPILNFFRSLGKSQEWALYEHGFSAKFVNAGKGTGDEKFEFWHDYKSCRYDANSVTLLPVQVFKRKVRMRTATNALDIYSLCRERISIAQAQMLHRSSRMPSAPNTPERRRMAQLDKQYAKRTRANDYR